MKYLLSVVLLISVIGCSKSVNSNEECNRYLSYYGDLFELCQESCTYTWKDRSGSFEDITDSVDHWVIARLYVLDSKDTIYVEYPSLVDTKYNFIYVSTNNISWETYKIE